MQRAQVLAAAVAERGIADLSAYTEKRLTMACGSVARPTSRRHSASVSQQYCSSLIVAVDWRGRAV